MKKRELKKIVKQQREIIAIQEETIVHLQRRLQEEALKDFPETKKLEVETGLPDLSPPIDLFDTKAVLDGSAPIDLHGYGSVVVVGSLRSNEEVQTEEEYLTLKNSVTISQYAKDNGLRATDVLLKIIEWIPHGSRLTKQVHVNMLLTPAEVDQLDLAFAYKLRVKTELLLDSSGSAWPSRSKQPPFQPHPPTDLRGAVIDGAGQHWRRNRGSGLID